MKKLIYVCLSLLLYGEASAQKIPDFSSIPLEKKEDFNTSANDAALTAANYLFQTPITDTANPDRMQSIQYLITWMSRTPEYTFSIDESTTRFANGDPQLLLMYMAAMTQYSLSRKNEKIDDKELKINALKLIINYAKNPASNVAPNEELEKAIEADNRNELAQYLEL